jgi:hypothetical protein
MKIIPIMFILCLLALAGCSTANRSGFAPAEYEHLNETCTVLGPVDFEIIPFGDGPILRAFVPVRLEAPAASSETIKLILVSCAVRDYNGPKQGAEWREIGSRQHVEVFRNRASGEYYLANNDRQ